VTSFGVAFAGSRQKPASISLESGRWSEILERNGNFIKKVRTDKPGYLILEDEWQLVAEPFRRGTMSKK
jgi:hypothetical protein